MDDSVRELKTLFQKVWNAHVVHQLSEGAVILYIDRHLVNEVTSPQAFESLRVAGRQVRRPDATIAVADHNVPTDRRAGGLQAIKNAESKLQVATLEANVAEFGVPYIPLVSGAKASIISSVPSWASLCQEPRSCVATATLRLTEPSARLRSASAPAK